MKIFKLLLVAVILSTTAGVSAQDLKFGHVNVQELIARLPVKQAADKALQDEASKLQDQLKVMSEELDRKYTDYMAQRDSLSELIRATREKEIQDYDKRIQNFNRLAQQSLGKKEQELLQPIVEKVQKAIDEVGKEQGFIYIFDLSSKVVLYNSDQSTDCAALVEGKLKE
jgi:outer membrane protein